MNCIEYQERHSTFSALPLSREVWDTPEWEAWMNHFHHCQKCSDWNLYQEIKKRGHNPEAYPCVHIANQLTWYCEKHPNPRDCTDVLIIHNETFDEYEIANRHGDSSVTIIQFCPWCGVKLPEAKRDRWFKELEALGFDNPLEQDIPEKYKTSAWYAGNA
jgi:hypothetical protein